MKKLLLVWGLGIVGLFAESPCYVVDVDEGASVVNVEVCVVDGGYIDRIGTISIDQEPAEAYPYDAIRFNALTNQSNGITVSMTFPDGSVPDALQKCKQSFEYLHKVTSRNEDQLVPPMMPWECSVIEGATLQGNTWSYYIEDNGPLDTDMRIGFIADPVLPLFSISVPLSTSAKVLLAMLFAFAAFFMMSRRKIA